MKKVSQVLLLTVLPQLIFAQSYPHFTMFMFNKLLYNPAYAGNKDLTEVNAYYRDQWTGIDGAPKTMSVSIDGPAGSYMSSFRKVALGLSVSYEKLGVTTFNNINAYYAYRIPMRKSVLSFGLQAGGSIYSAHLSDLNPYQPNDQVISQNVSNRFLSNFGTGIYWRGERFYAGAAVPNLLENYYSKDHMNTDGASNKQIRIYYLSGGYVFSLSDDLKLEPQAFFRYAGDVNANLPMNADVNLSLIIYDRLLIGATYRTDGSVEGIVHMQVTNELNIGYAYDYTVSYLKNYNYGTHEITIGFDFIKDRNKYINPRFVKLF